MSMEMFVPLSSYKTNSFGPQRIITTGISKDSPLVLLGRVKSSLRLHTFSDRSIQLQTATLQTTLLFARTGYSSYLPRPETKLGLQ